MKKLFFVFVLALFSISIATAQDCNCRKNLEWVKKTFEENDAGFEYALKNKSRAAYDAHNTKFFAKIDSVKNVSECAQLLRDWLAFFRSGHIGIRINDPYIQKAAATNSKQDKPWDVINFDKDKFIKYLDGLKEPGYEGIWQTGQYIIGIQKSDGDYVGFVMESQTDAWKPGEKKLGIASKMGAIKTVYFMLDRSAVYSNTAELIGKNYLKVGDITLKRIYPIIKDDPKYSQYFRSLDAQKPYIEKLSEKTLYFRIPSFQSNKKREIDSVIKANRETILKTENLIIDIKNGTGGSDGSYSEIIPLIYTNPIRSVGVEIYSTPLNNQRMLDFINKPEYGFNEEGKKWAQNAYDKLSKRVGEFVMLNENVVSVTKLDTIYPFPKNVGIIINKNNGSTDEQFLLAAKQSKKVKLFGTTTFGVLDISNMYYVNSPDGIFQLGYCLTRSMRIPDFTIDNKGIQPDFYIDKSIPQYEWNEFVKTQLEY